MIEYQNGETFLYQFDLDSPSSDKIKDDIYHVKKDSKIILL